MKAVNQRLVAHAHIRQSELQDRADRAANAAERAVQEAWGDMLYVLKNDPWTEAVRMARILPQHIFGRIDDRLGTHLHRIFEWGQRTAVDAIKQSVPEEDLIAPLVVKHVREDLEIKDFFDQYRYGEPSGKSGSIWDLLFPAFTPHQVNRIIYGGNWIERLAASTRLANPDDLARIVSQGLVGGKSHQEIARELRPHVQGVVASARRIARTECLRVAMDVQLTMHSQLGPLIEGWMLLATLDHNSRVWHAHRNGQIYYVNPQPGQKGLRQRPTPPDEPEDPAERPAGTPGTAWNCLLPGNKVQGRFLSGARSIYAGQTVKVLCRSGLSVWVTINHPIMTAQGWVAAKHIQVGHYLASYVREAVYPPLYEKNKPMAIEHVFRTLAQFSAVSSHRRPASFEEFHGDGIRLKGEIDVVKPERKLLGDNQPHFSQSSGYALLVGRGTQAFFVASSRAGLFARSCVDFPSACFVSCEDLPEPGFTLDPTPLGCFGFRLVPKLNTISGEKRCNGSTAYASVISELENTIPSNVSFDDFGGNFNAMSETLCLQFGAKSNASFFEVPTKRIPLDANFSSKRLQPFTSEVAFDEVIEIRYEHYEGPVFDLETDSGYFVANMGEECSGIIVKNCRCTLVPVLRKPSKEVLSDAGREVFAQNAVVPDLLTMSDWFDRAPARLQRHLVGVKRHAVVSRNAERPQWHDFVDFHGRLVDIDRLRTETDRERLFRTERVRKQLANRAAAMKQQATMGFQ